jgi:hypothetical protein
MDLPADDENCIVWLKARSAELKAAKREGAPPKEPVQQCHNQQPLLDGGSTKINILLPPELPSLLGERFLGDSRMDRQRIAFLLETSMQECQSAKRQSKVLEERLKHMIEERTVLHQEMDALRNENDRLRQYAVAALDGVVQMYKARGVAGVQAARESSDTLEEMQRRIQAAAEAFERRKVCAERELAQAQTALQHETDRSRQLAQQLSDSQLVTAEREREVAKMKTIVRQLTAIIEGQ